MPELTFDDLVKVRQTVSSVGAVGTAPATATQTDWLSKVDVWLGRFVEAVTHIDNIMQNAVKIKGNPQLASDLKTGLGIVPQPSQQALDIEKKIHEKLNNNGQQTENKSAT